MDEHFPLTLEKLGITAEDLKFNVDKIIYDNSASQQEMIKAINMRNIDIPIIENPIVQTNNLLQQQSSQLADANSFLEKQLNEVKENNIQLGRKLQDLKQQIIALQTKPKKWYQKVGVKIALFIWLILSTIIVAIVTQIVVANWDIIVGLFK